MTDFGVLMFPTDYAIQPIPLARAAEERFRALLIDAVKRQLVGDVSVGIFLSSGIDSGLVLWAACQAAGGDVPAAYTVGFDDRSFDESELAMRTAQHLGAEHRMDRLPAPGSGDLDDMISAFGEPFANTSIPANLLVSRAAARHVKVALKGSGATTPCIRRPL